MKYIYIMAVIALASCKTAQKVYNPHTPHFGDNQIILLRTTPIDSIELVLFERGFTIDSKNKELGIISTKERKLVGVEGAVRVRVQIKDKYILFTGEYAINYDITLSPFTLKRSFEKVEFGGMKGSIMRQAFYAVDNVAKQIGGEIVYSK